MSLIIGGGASTGGSSGGGASDEEVAQIRNLANAANSNATDALNTANAAKQTADTATTKVADVKVVADAAKTAATSATAAATNAGTKADDAVNKSADAVSVAAGAVSVANNSLAKANEAKEAGVQAVAVANNANASASDAATKAAAALGAISPLANRVSTLETKAQTSIDGLTAVNTKVSTNTSDISAIKLVNAKARTDLDGLASNVVSNTDRITALENKPPVVGVAKWPNVAKADLTTTWKALDHENEEAYCTDADVNQPIYARGGKWYKLADNSLLTSDPVDPGTIVNTLRRGWSIAGMEYAEKTFPGVEGTNYFKPIIADFIYMQKNGANLCRLPYLWERAQPTLFGDLDPTWISYIKEARDMAKANGVVLLLDMHNYCRRFMNGNTYLFGTTQVPVTAFADFYQKLGLLTANDDTFWGVDLVNEPYGMPVTATPLNYYQRDFIQLLGDPTTDDTDLDANWYAPAPFTVQRTGGRTKGGIKYSSTSAQYKQMRRRDHGNDVGIPVTANTTYTMTFWYKQAFTSGSQTLTVNANANTGSDGAVQLYQQVLTNVADYSRVVVSFKTGAGVSKVFFDLTTAGAAGEAWYCDFNMTVGATIQPTVTWAFNGEVATTTLLNNAAIAAFRSTGNTGWCIAEYDNFSGMSSFTSLFGSNPDWWLKDPLNRTQLNVHYYFDPDHGGSYNSNWTQNCTDRMEGEVRPVFQWGKDHGVKIFTGEFGVPSDGSSSTGHYQDLLEAFWKIMDEFNYDGTYWAAGSHFFSATSMHPENNYTVDKSVMTIVRRHMPGNIGTTPTVPSNQLYYNGQEVMYNGQNVVYGA